MLLPLALLAGGSMDYVRHQNAQTVAQSAADAAALAAAVAISNREDNYEAIARDTAALTLRGTLASHAEMTHFAYDPDANESEVIVTGEVSTTFLNLIAIQTLPFSASSTATSSMEGSTEVALVLDNTWSMSVMTSMGVSRISALKDASSRLVTTLTANPDADVKIGLVPYVNYVNVGLANRDQDWLDVPADYREVVPASGSCTTVTSQRVCRNVGPAKTCTRTNVRDGVTTVEEYTCYDQECETVPVDPPRTSCPSSTTRNWRWHGCVYSRLHGLHVADGSPEVRHVGIMETGSSSANCRNAITPLTDDTGSLHRAITNMNIGTGGTPRDTYIPAGLLWGLNLLAPGAPFEGALDYDESNERPRKAIVLMTDGANTMYLASQPAVGQHLQANTVGRHVATTNATHIQNTNRDTVSICSLAKSRGIEVYSIAFEVTDPGALEAMRSCATSLTSHYFDASNAEALYAAFDQIARSLMTVRLVR